MSFRGFSAISKSLVAILLLAPLISTAQSTSEQPRVVTITSCRTFQTSIPPPTQVTSKLDTPLASPTTSCATETRGPRVSLVAEPGVFVKVNDEWGTCSQIIQFGFDANWRNYKFGAAYYDDPGAGCEGTPTATLSCDISVTGPLIADETLRVAPTAPFAGRMNGTNGDAAGITCSPT